MTADRRAALEAAIDADPEDPRTYAVYADYLQELGDPRGELIALQLRDDPDLEGAARAYRDKHAATLIPLAGDASPMMVWRNGYVHRATIDSLFEARRVLSHPSLRFLVELALRRAVDMNPMLGVVASEPRPALRRLDVGVGRYGAPHDVPLDLAPLWPAAAHLRKLVVRGIDVGFGTGDVPLAELRIEAGNQYGDDNAVAIARARWPALERLELAINSHGETKPRLAIAVRDALRVDLPALRWLSLRGVIDGRFPETMAVFDAPTTFSRVEWLDLSDSMLGDAEARYLLERRDLFANLRQLDVTNNRMTPAGIAMLAEVATLVGGRDQWNPVAE